MITRFIKTTLEIASFSLLAVVVFALAACADPKAYDTYGMSDPTGAINYPEIMGDVNERLEKIYDDFDISVFFHINYDNPDGAAADFYEYSVEPYLGEAGGIRRGIVLGWSASPKLGRATDYGVVKFPPEDGEEMGNIYPFSYISETIERLAKKSPNERDFFKALARELYERAKDCRNGADSGSGGVLPTSLEAPEKFNVSVKRDEYGDGHIRVGFAVPESVGGTDAISGITVNFELDWNIDGEGWASENGDKGVRGFTPHSVGALDGPFDAEKVVGDYHMFTKEDIYQFRGYFEFQNGDRTIRSPYTKTVKVVR
jgi:hypothetical protein